MAAWGKHGVELLWVTVIAAFIAWAAGPVAIELWRSLR